MRANASLRGSHIEADIRRDLLVVSHECISPMRSPRIMRIYSVLAISSTGVGCLSNRPCWNNLFMWSLYILDYIIAVERANVFTELMGLYPNKYAAKLNINHMNTLYLYSAQTSHWKKGDILLSLLSRSYVKCFHSLGSRNSLETRLIR